MSAAVTAGDVADEDLVWGLGGVRSGIGWGIGHPGAVGGTLTITTDHDMSRWKGDAPYLRQIDAKSLP